MAKFCGKCGALVENGSMPEMWSRYIKGRHRLYYINAEKRREIKLRYTLLLIVFYGYAIGALQLV